MPRFVQDDGRVHAIVVGCRREDGRWLMVRRSPRVTLFPNAVCFPGGGVEAGETQFHACIRELLEELNLRVHPLRQVWRHEFADHPLTLFGWLADYTPGRITPAPDEIAEILWLNRSEAIAHPDGLATNESFITALEAEWAQRQKSL